ncbi:hypothetical protein FPANT_6194 [Fusarium pseudoanthophilum]|uniref:DUF6546 domain-containing protein n=1 Tax=Fusarium pseudoanthophilum TaxID=48495 RepID=A0A8H5LFL9_9HYPO|nr:hypothetical protein FPANT_6194 [Fusarium pseudoanthophilum]
MRSPSPNERLWNSLPSEIRLLVLQSLTQDGSSLACLAAVSRAWQTDVERYNFSRIRLTPSRLADFRSMIRRNQGLCAPRGGVLSTDEAIAAVTVSDTEHRSITTAFQGLLSVLSEWDQDSNVMLDISIYSPSDAQHWFPYLTFMPDSPSNRLEGSGLELTTINQSYHDPPHGWVTGFRQSAPHPAAVRKAFHYIVEEGEFDDDESEFQWWDQLPSVSSVTSILLRQQSRRRWEPRELTNMLARFPRLQEFHYEPWREWEGFSQRTTDKVFMQRFLDGEDLAGCDSFRIPSPAVGRMMALTSLPLEHLAASFIIDASHFFAIDSTSEWPNLTSLVLTSQLLKPEEDPTKMDALLEAAAVAALRMPRLETLEIWNGRKGLAALFQYRRIRGSRHGRILWRGTWKYHITTSVLQAWEAVGHLHTGWRLDVVQEQVDEAAIQSHGDALQHLMLSGQAIRSVSLQQIQREQKFLEGVDILS